MKRGIKSFLVLAVFGLLFGMLFVEGVSAPIPGCNPSLGASGCTEDCNDIFGINVGSWDYDSYYGCVDWDLVPSFAVSEDSLCDAGSTPVPGTEDFGCAADMSHGSGEVSWICPSYERFGEPITIQNMGDTSDPNKPGDACICVEINPSRFCPDYTYDEIFNFSNEFFAGPPCIPDDRIMKLYSSTNSHGALWDDAVYTYDICYPDIFGVVYAGGTPHTCSGTNEVLSLFDINNSHAETPELSGYTNDVCYGDLVRESDSSAGNSFSTCRK